MYESGTSKSLQAALCPPEQSYAFHSPTENTVFSWIVSVCCQYMVAKPATCRARPNTIITRATLDQALAVPQIAIARAGG